MSESDRFSHEHLPAGPNGVRLLTVLSTEKDGLLQCKIEDGKTTDQYTALSYTWGPSTHDQDILLNGKLFQVRRNLWDFLHVAKDSFLHTKFWIDAVCINQEDTSERNEQVRRMGQIYSSAATTLTWLGPCAALVETTTNTPSANPEVSVKLRNFDPELEACLNVFRERKIPPQISKLSRKQGIPPDYRIFGPISTVIELICLHPYWQRVWIVQEVKLSTHRIVVFDRLKMQWHLLVEVLDYVIGAQKLRRLPFHQILLAKNGAFRTLVKHEQNRFLGDLGLQSNRKIRRGSYVSLLSKYLLSGIFSSQSAHAELGRLRDQYSDEMVRQLTCPKDATQRNKTSGEVRFLDLIRGFEKSLCHDIRDKIYGFTAMQEPGVSFPIDYSLTVYDLYYRACRFFLFPDNKADPLWAWNWTITASVLAQQLKIGLLDLIFGDAQHRSSVVLVADSVPAWMSRNISVLIQTCYKDSNNWPTYTIAGNCVSCTRLVHFESPIPSLLGFCVLQCHKPLTGWQALTSSNDAEHLIVYRSQGLPGHHSVRSSVSAVEAPVAANLASEEPLLPLVFLSLPMLTDLVGLHMIYPRLLAQKSHEQHHSRRRKPAESPLLTVLGQLLVPSTKISSVKFTQQMLRTLNLDPQTEQSVMRWFASEKFNIETE